MKLYLLFCICYPIFLNDIIDDTICMINADIMLTLDDGDIEKI